ncbi:MAG TPA: hypothetical protein PLM75_01625, partial [bacterium]|nr:hypothetical protein [bacterium]
TGVPETGDWYYRVVATDMFGNSTATNWTYIISLSDTPSMTGITVEYPVVNNIVQTAAKLGDTVVIKGIIFNSENDTKVELLVGPNQTAIAMKDDGTSGDEIANDKVFTAQVVVGTDIYTGDTVNILITNKNGDTILYSISVEVDTEINQPSITSPQANIAVSGAVELKATGDADIIKAKWYYYRSGLVQQLAVEKVLIAEIDGLSDTALMPTLALADDTYTILLTVIDRANNSVDTEIKVYVDNNRPGIYAISVEYPTENGIEQTAAKNDDVVRISALIQSEAQIDTVYIKVNNDTTVFMTTPMNDGVYIANLTVGNHITASANTLRIYAGNVNSDTTIVNIDNTAPTFIFSDLQNGDTISNSSLIGITAAADDIRRVIYRGSATRSGVTMNFDIADKTDTNKISFIWPQILGDGYCTITVNVYDKANNETTGTIAVWIDNTKPIVDFVNPAAHSYNSGNIAVNFTAVDTNIIKTIKVYVNGAIIADSSYSSNSINDTFYWNTSNDSRVQGQVIFRVVAIDTVGNENYAERPIFIDNSRPTVALLKPDTMTYISGVYQVRAITSNADELWYNVKGAGVDSNYVVSPFNPDTYIDFGIYSNGNYTIAAIAKNSVSGNTTASASMIIIIDNTPVVFQDPITVTPGPWLLTSANTYTATVYRDWASIAMNISDSNTEDLRVEVTSNAVIRAQYASSSNASDSNIKVVVNLEEGANTITVSITDKAGNIASKQVILNYIKPVITSAPSIVDTTTASIISPTATDTQTATIVVAPDSTSIYIPQGALTQAVPLTIREIPEQNIITNEYVSLNSDSVVTLKVGREFGPSGTIFEKPIRIGIKYYESDLEELKEQLASICQTFEYSKLRIRYWNGRYYEDVRFDTVDVNNQIVYGFVTHFSQYILGYDMRLASSTNTKSVYVTKNPMVVNTTGSYDAEKGTEFKIDYDADDISTFKVEIFTLRGQRVVVISQNYNEVYWDGLSENKKFIGTGLYIYKATVVLKSGEVITTVKPIGLLRN